MTPGGGRGRRRHLSTAGLRCLAASAAIGMTLIGGTGGRLADGQAPRPGGTLVLTQWEDPPHGFAIHETSTISTLWPAMPIRRPPQLGQNPRPFLEKGTRRSNAQPSQRTRLKPWSRIPPEKGHHVDYPRGAGETARNPPRPFRPSP